MKTNIGRVIRDRRLQLGLSQEILAKHLRFKNSQFISNIERGQCSLPLKYINKMSKILKFSSSFITSAMEQDFMIDLHRAVKRYK